MVEDIVREVFLFPSAGDSLYGSLYAASRPGAGGGLVICPAWGWESSWTLDGAHRLGLEAARRGGAALVFHWPGHGDSEGDPEDATVDRLVEAAGDALAAASGRLSGLDWGLAGVRLGATAAVLATAALGTRRLLLVQPALDPPGWLSELDRLGGGATSGWLGGFPVSEAFRRSASGAATKEAVAAFEGWAGVARYERPPLVEVPDRWGVRTVPGDWRRYIRTDHRALFDAAADLLPAFLEER